MTALAPARVGWCPGALRPMATGDGLLVRLKPRGGILSLTQAGAVADLALRHGNGILDMTARANLQIRGVTDDSYAPLLGGLEALGLLDTDPETEAIRNIVCSPLAGLDNCAPIDVTSIAADLEAVLRDEADLHRLPAKWNFVIDDGDRLSLREVAADIRFEALPDGSVAVALASDPTFAICRPERVAGLAADLSRRALAADGARMGDLVRQRSAADLLEAVGLHPAGALPSRPRTVAHDLVGPQFYGAMNLLGLAPPFGTLRASHLLALAERAEALRARDFRLTPWRVVLVTGLTAPGALALAADLPDDTWITRQDDSRLAVAACSGQSACPRGSTPVPVDAASVAAALAARSVTPGIAVHVSGCAKGCAHPRSAPLTLVGRAGRYDLVLNGKAGDKPVETGLPLAAALRRIEAHLT